MPVYYSDDLVTIIHGDARDEPAWLDADVLLFDPPYGVDYQSGSRREQLAASIENDKDTTVRDEILRLWGPSRAALCFGSWKIERPAGTLARLVWDTGGALGMGDLRIPWKPADQEIYVLGDPAAGWRGRRDNNVLRFAPVQSMARNGRVHPHQKPVPLLEELLRKMPEGVVADPCGGSGSTAVAAALHGRRSIIVELREAYCEIAANRVVNSRGLDLGEIPDVADVEVELFEVAE